MNKSILIGSLLLSSTFMFNANANEAASIKGFENSEVSFYADYFGFSNVGDYLKFATKVNKLMDGQTPNELTNSILEEPVWLEYKATVARGETPSELDKTKLKALLLERQIKLLNYVGLKEGDYKHLDRFVDFSNSNKRYTASTQSGGVSTRAAQDSIVVSCDELCERQIRADEIYK